MPIRFRCVHCNQLLGIARRKAGMMVRCPSCAVEVLVPSADNPEDLEVATEQQPPEPVEDQPAPVFERSDFEEAFRPPASQVTAPSRPPAPPLSPEPAGSWAEAEEAEINVERVPVPQEVLEAVQQGAARPGIWVSPTMATVLSVLVVIALALAFAAGLAVGLFFRSPK
jgi:hypothetical protein